MYDTSSGKKSGPLAMVANGTTLECDLSPADGNENLQAATQFAQFLLGKMTGLSEFELVFTPTGTGRLDLSFGGTGTSAQAQALLAAHEEFTRH